MAWHMPGALHLHLQHVHWPPTCDVTNSIGPIDWALASSSTLPLWQQSIGAVACRRTPLALAPFDTGSTSWLDLIQAAAQPYHTCGHDLQKGKNPPVGSSISLAAPF